MLVILDEASLASTAHLDSLLSRAASAGPKLLLVGGHHQLGAVEAGGAFALLAETTTDAGTAHTLDALWRFTNHREADATRALRAGHPSALDTDAMTRDRAANHAYISLDGMIDTDREAGKWLVVQRSRIVVGVYAEPAPRPAGVSFADLRRPVARRADPQAPDPRVIRRHPPPAHPAYVR